MPFLSLEWIGTRTDHSTTATRVESPSPPPGTGGIPEEGCRTLRDQVASS